MLPILELNTQVGKALQLLSFPNLGARIQNVGPTFQIQTIESLALNFGAQFWFNRLLSYQTRAHSHAAPKFAGSDLLKTFCPVQQIHFALASLTLAPRNYHNFHGPV